MFNLLYDFKKKKKNSLRNAKQNNNKNNRVNVLFALSNLNKSLPNLYEISVLYVTPNICFFKLSRHRPQTLTTSNMQFAKQVDSIPVFYSASNPCAQTLVDKVTYIFAEMRIFRFTC